MILSETFIRNYHFPMNFAPLNPRLSIMIASQSNVTEMFGTAIVDSTVVACHDRTGHQHIHSNQG